VNKIGNLLHRTSSFIYKNCQEKIPTPNQIKEQDKKIFAQAYNMPNIIKKLLAKQDLKRILEEIINLASSANIYIDEEAPWKLKKTDTERMHTVLYVLMEVTRAIAIPLQAFMPEHAGKILDYLHVKERSLAAINSGLAIKANTKIQSPEIIFKKIDT
jgi:methionyl-tRNA synthetase